MKRNKIVLLSSFLLVLSACGPHEHTYSSRYQSNDEFHWQPALCHPEEKRNYGAHDFGPEKTDAAGRTYQQCIVCRKKVYIDTEGGGFSGVTEFANPIEIHTEYQKRFLSYEGGSYDKMPQNSYPDGTKNISDPEFTRIVWKYNGHRKDLTYSISISRNEDMEDSFVIIGNNEQYIDAYNFYLGKNYYRINALDPFGETVSSKVYSLTVNDVYPRNLYVGSKMTNCRDTGGRTISTGGKIKQGLLFRTCGNGYKQDGKKIDDEGKEIMMNQLHVKTELNCHNNTSYNFNFEGTTLYDTLMDYQENTPSKHHFSRNTESVKNIFEILSNVENYPAFYHCRIGTDRTGLVAILLNGVLGVSLNDIYQDYLFSNFGRIGDKRVIGDTSKSDDISIYINEIKRLPGLTFNEQCYNALLTIGVPKTTIEKIYDILIDGKKPNYENEQIVVEAKDMAIANGQAVNEPKASITARDNPASYVTLNAGVSATATFDIVSAGDKVAYIYIGNNDASPNKWVNTSITATLDGNKTIDIPQINFKEAGMGYCGSNRTNYYFVKLGDLGNVLSGQHTITVTGISNGLNLGNIAIL